MLGYGEGNSVALCKLCRGIDLHVHAYFPYYIVWIIFGNLSTVAQNSDYVGWIIFEKSMHVVFLFGTVLIHELGHSFMTLYVGGTVSKILLWPFGGIAYCGFHRNVKKQLAVSCAGPAVHIPLFLAFFFIWKVADTCDADNFNPFGYFNPSTCFITNILNAGMALQIMLFCFNVFVPIYPLDGAKIFICLVKLSTDCSIATLGNICIYTSGAMALGLGTWFILKGDLYGMFLVLWMGRQVVEMYIMKSNGRLQDHPLFSHMPERETPVARSNEEVKGIEFESKEKEIKNSPLPTPEPDTY